VGGRVAVEVGRPLGRALLAAEPGFGRSFQGGQNLRLDLPVPGEDLPRRSIVPALEDQAVMDVDPQAPLPRRPSLAKGEPARRRPSSR
jgi:hypothetical protein